MTDLITLNSGSDRTVRRRIAWLVLRVALCAGLLAFVIAKLSWHDQVCLRDGREASLISPCTASDEVVVRVADDLATVRASDILVQKPGLASLLRSADLHVGFVAILLTLPVPFFSALRFDYILRGMGLTVPRRRVMQVSLTSYLVNLAMPGATGGDLYRALALQRDARSLPAIVAGLFIDRVAGLLALMTWAGLAALFWLHDASFGRIGRLVIAALAAVLLVIVLIIWANSHRHLRNMLQRFRFGIRLVKLMERVERLLKSRSTLARVLIASMIVQCFNLASVAAIGYAIGIDHALEAALLVMPFAMVVAAFTPTPQGLGALEGVLVLVLAPFVRGGANACILLAVGVRMMRLPWALLGASVLLARPASTRGQMTPERRSARQGTHHGQAELARQAQAQ